MTWQLAYQTFTTGLSAVAIWFIYELIKEYKKFREEATKDFSQIKLERKEFKLMVEATLSKFEHLKLSMEQATNVFTHELNVFRHLVTGAVKESKEAKEFMEKSYAISKTLHGRLSAVEADLKKTKADVEKITRAK